jgi:hypothetical protein
MLDEKLKEVQAQLGTVQQDLNANISFAPREGTLDKEEVVNRFGALCDQINATAIGILRRVPPELLKDSFIGFRGHKDIEAFEKDELEFMEMARIISNSKELTYFDVLLPLLWHVLSADIHTHILRGFTSANDDNGSKFLEDLYSEVQRAESQEQGARWRAMTYTHMRRDEPRSFRLSADQSLQRISLRIREAFATSDNLIPIEECLPHMESLFESAADFWSSTQTMCTKYHVEVMGPSFEKNPTDDFVQEDRKRAPTRIMLTFKLGLFGTLKSEDPESRHPLKKHLLSKRIVIGDNWAGAVYAHT